MDEMILTYDIAVETTYGSVSFTITGEIDGAEDEIRAVAAIISRFVDFNVTADGEISISVNVPDDFAKLVLRAAENGQLPEWLKHKVFAAFGADINGIYNLYNELSTYDLITILEHIDFNGLLDKDVLANYVDLNGYTQYITLNLQRKVTIQKG